MLTGMCPGMSGFILIVGAECPAVEVGSAGRLEQGFHPSLSGLSVRPAIMVWKGRLPGGFHPHCRG